MLTNQPDKLDFCSIMDQMDKGFVLREALYDDAGRICDFKIVAANKGIDNFISIPHEELIGSTLDKKNRYWESMLAVFTKVASTGESSEFEYYSTVKKRYVKLFSFCPTPNYIANYYEFISDSRFSEDKTNDATARMMQVSDYVNEAFWVRKGNRALYVNPAFEKLFGISCSKVYEDIYAILEVVDARDYTRVLEMLQNDGTHLETNYHIEFRIRCANNKYRWLWLKTFYIKEMGGKITRKAATVIDITERKLLEEQVYRYNQEVLTLFDLFKKATEQVELHELLNEAQHVILNHMSLKAICIYLYDEKTESLKRVTSDGVPQKILDNELNIAKELNMPEQFFSTKESLMAHVLKFSCEEARTSLLHEGFSYIGCFPILYADKPLGLMLLGLNSEQDLATGHKEFIMAICSQMAVLINNWRLYENLKHELEMRKKAEQEKELIFNTSIDLLAILDLDVKLKRIGPQWEKCLGWNEIELLDQSIMSLVHPEDKDDTLGFFDTLAAEGIVIGFENRLLCKDGTARWFAWNAQVVKENNKKLIVVTGRDITRNKEIEAKNRDLEHAYQLETLKMEFFANISHEFRTPLNIILSALQLIQHSVSEHIAVTPMHERAMRHFKSIKQNALRLLRLVNNLIDITKLDSGYLKLYRCNYDIVNVVENITQSVAQYIEGKGINLIFDTDVEEKILSCDADMIERILLNLLSNAVKYTEKGGFITVTIKDLGDVARISVHDTGVGIPEEKLDYIFERFAQGDRPLSRRCEGSGIGLSLVKSLVELHNGRIYANSTINKGSEFTFELPAVVMEECANCQAMKPSNEERIHKINVEFSDIYSLNN